MPDADWTGDVADVLLSARRRSPHVIEECLRQRHSRCAAARSSITTRTTAPPTSASRSRRSAACPAPANGAICLFSDLTDIVELEEQLRLKDSLAQVGELTAGIAHEFRNGLATIHGYARLLDLERLPADTRPYVIGIRDETDTLGAVVRNFLNFARPADVVLDDGRHAPIVERAAEEIRATPSRAAARSTVRGEFVPVLGDEVLLRQAFSNLCRNALEACTEARRRPAHHDREHRSIAAQRVVRIAVDRQRPRRGSGGRVAHLHAVRHDARPRHRPRPRAGAEDHRDAQRPRDGPDRARRRHALRRLAPDGRPIARPPIRRKIRAQILRSSPPPDRSTAAPIARHCARVSANFVRLFAGPPFALRVRVRAEACDAPKGARLQSAVGARREGRDYEMRSFRL